jgi:hypothetical protein
MVLFSSVFESSVWHEQNAQSAKTVKMVNSVFIVFIFCLNVLNIVFILILKDFQSFYFQDGLLPLKVASEKILLVTQPMSDTFHLSVVKANWQTARCKVLNQHFKK